MEQRNIEQKYNKDLITELETTELISEEDHKILEGNMGMVKRSMLHSQLFRTETEMEVSVLQNIKHPTADSKYWQSMRELNVMSSELFSLNFEYKIKQSEYSELKQDIETSWVPEEMKALPDYKKNSYLARKKVELDQLNYNLLTMERTAKDRMREINMWSTKMRELEPLLACSPTDVNEHQVVSYPMRFAGEKLAQLQNNAQMGPGEARNAEGLLMTSLQYAEKKGKLRNVLTQLPQATQQMLIQKKIINVNQPPEKLESAPAGKEKAIKVQEIVRQPEEVNSPSE